MNSNPRYSLKACPYCGPQLPVPAGLSHCDVCHRTYKYEDGLVQNTSATRYDGKLKGVCDFCREKFR